MKKLEQTLSDVSLLQDETLDDSLSELNPHIIDIPINL